MASNRTTSAGLAANDLGEPTEPVVCDLSAIPANQRDAHVELVRTILFSGEHAALEVDDGLLFELPADRLNNAVRFVENERRCCRHLAFVLEVPPRGANITLRVTGPGAREELRALVR